jgi:hypothetical protein
MKRATLCWVFTAAALAAAMTDVGQSTAQGTGIGPSGMPIPGSAMQFPGPGTQQQNSIASQMFRGLDKNGDGVVTEQEFFAPHEQRFDALDVNHDGKLTSKEFESGPIFGRPQQPAK